jgi:hypothetical protein
MKWIVTGANPNTGTELTREIEANSRDEAEQLANSRGLLVSSVVAADTADDNALNALAGAIDRPHEDAPILPYASSSASLRNPIPSYDGITNGAKLLISSANAYRAMCVICIVLGIVFVVLAFVSAFSPGAPNGSPWASGLAACVAFILAIVLHQRSLMIRLQAELALAQRDIARNSFKMVG